MHVLLYVHVVLLYVPPMVPWPQRSGNIHNLSLAESHFGTVSYWMSVKNSQSSRVSSSSSIHQRMSTPDGSQKPRWSKLRSFHGFVWASCSRGYIKQYQTSTYAILAACGCTVSKKNHQGDCIIWGGNLQGSSAGRQRESQSRWRWHWPFWNHVTCWEHRSFIINTTPYSILGTQSMSRNADMNISR